MLFDDIEQYLASQGLLNDWKLYVDGFRDPHDRAINIQEYGNNYGPKGLNVGTRQIQVVVRAPDAVMAYLHAMCLNRCFVGDGETPLQLTLDRWAVFYVRGTPIKFKEDEHGRVYYVFNMSCTTTQY